MDDDMVRLKSLIELGCTRAQGVPVEREHLKLEPAPAGYWIRSTEPKQQLLEVVRRFRLMSHKRPFTRCMKCNTALEPINRESVIDRLPPGVRDRDEFRLCSTCGAIYWEGTHHARMSKMLEWVKAST